MPTRHERIKQAEVKRAQERVRKNIFIGVGVAVLLIVLIGSAIGFVQAQQNAPAPAPTLVAQVTQGQCRPIQDFPSQGNDHIAPNQIHPTYNSNPPTSGWHWANPQEWGLYETPQVQEQLVHNLEHGGIVIQYRDLSTADKDRLSALVRSDRYHLVLAPYPGLPEDATVALTAWTHLQLCNGVNENAIRTFISAYRDRGPELVP